MFLVDVRMPMPTARASGAQGVAHWVAPAPQPPKHWHPARGGAAGAAVAHGERPAGRRAGGYAAASLGIFSQQDKNRMRGAHADDDR